MKMFTSVLASLAAATFALNAQVQTTTSATTVTTPSTTVTTPQATATAPSATVATPSATVATPPAATVTTPSATVATPSATVAAPSATVTGQSETVATPPPTVETSPATAPGTPVTTTTGTVAAPASTATTPPPGHPIAGYVAQEDKWIEAPPALAGAQMMVLHGDINRAGPYTIRLLLPAGFQMPLHWHDNEVNLTVISGILHIGFAPNFDASNSKEIGALSFATLPPKMKHTLWTDVETVVQVHGLGPWSTHEAYPAATVRATP